MDLKEAIDILSKTRDPLYSVALGLPVDAYEAAEAFATAVPDTADYVCLKILTEVHPVPKIAPDPVPEPKSKTKQKLEPTPEV